MIWKILVIISLFLMAIVVFAPVNMCDTILMPSHVNRTIEQYNDTSRYNKHCLYQEIELVGLVYAERGDYKKCLIWMNKRDTCASLLEKTEIYDIYKLNKIKTCSKHFREYLKQRAKKQGK